MRKEPPRAPLDAYARKTLRDRLRQLRHVTARKSGIDEIRTALISSGCTSLDDQAKALGVHRATAWTIIRNRHKLGRLSTKTIERIIANPTTPPLVLTAVHEYVRENLETAD